MPCWERRTITMNLETASPDLLRAALREGGWYIHLDEEDRLGAYHNAQEMSLLIESGEVEIKSKKSDELMLAAVGEIKKSYARQVVSYAAKRYGFTVTQEKGNANRATLKRRN